MNNWSKDDEDWFNILGGESVSDADPEVAKHAHALRGALYVQQNRHKLPPLPKSIIQKDEHKNIAPVKQRYGQIIKLHPFFAVVMTCIFLVIPIIHYQGWLTENGRPAVEKSIVPYFIDDILTSRKDVIQFQKTLQIEGIQFTDKQEGNIWIFQFPLQPALQYQKLVVLLASYDRKISSSNSHAVVRFIYDETP